MHRQLFQIFRQIPIFFLLQLHVYPVETLERRQRSQVNVQEVVVPQVKVRQLQHPEQLQSHDLATQQRTE